MLDYLIISLIYCYSLNSAWNSILSELAANLVDTKVWREQGMNALNVWGGTHPSRSTESNVKTLVWSDANIIVRIAQAHWHIRRMIIAITNGWSQTDYSNLRGSKRLVIPQLKRIVIVIGKDWSVDWVVHRPLLHQLIINPRICNVHISGQEILMRKEFPHYRIMRSTELRTINNTTVVEVIWSGRILIWIELLTDVATMAATLHWII